MEISRRDFLKGVLVSSAMALVPKSLFKEKVEKMLPTDTAVYWQQSKSLKKWDFKVSSKDSAMKELGEGGVSNLKIYDHALSPDEINLIYQRERGMYDSPFALALEEAKKGEWCRARIL